MVCPDLCPQTPHITCCCAVACCVECVTVQVYLTLMLLAWVQSSLISRPEKKEEKETFSGLGTRERAKIEAKVKRVDKYPW